MENNETQEDKELPKDFNVWKASTIAVIIILGVVVVFSFGAGGMATTGKATAISASDAGKKVVDYINENLVQDGGATYVDTTEENGVYKVTVNYQDQDIDVYATLDGTFLFLSPPLDMNEEIEIPTQEPEEVPQTETPEVDVFIMSYCPYGLQMQKAFLPVMELLGDKADIKIRFVNYAMHGQKEIDENTRQYCIQKEQGDKLVEYLKCFTATDDTETCQDTAEIDTTKLATCVAAADGEFSITENVANSQSPYPPYLVDDSLNSMYGVQGSPTVVINGKTVSLTRSPEAVKEAVCSAFITPPAECEQTLSSTPTSAGIGADAGTTSGGSCA